MMLYRTALRNFHYFTIADLKDVRLCLATFSAFRKFELVHIMASKCYWLSQLAWLQQENLVRIST